MGREPSGTEFDSVRFKGGGTLGVCLTELSRLGDASTDEERDQAARSRSLFLGGGGRTMDSERSKGWERSGPYSCSTRSISSSSSGDVGVGGIAVNGFLGNNVDFSS